MLKSLLMTTLFSLSGLVAYADVVSYQINGKMIELDKQVADLGVQAGNIIKQGVPVKDEGIKADWLAVFSVFEVASYTHGNFVKKGLNDTQATEASLIAYFVSHDIPIIQGLAWLDSLPALDTSALTKTNGSESNARLEEIQRRSELYALKLTKLKANLLDRAEVETAFCEIVSAIKRIIDRSRLSRSEKADIYANLLTPAEFAANVARQSADRAKGEASPVIGNGGIDHVEVM